jgi:hypothetical protein
MILFVANCLTTSQIYDIFDKARENNAIQTLYAAAAAADAEKDDMIEIVNFFKVKDIRFARITNAVSYDALFDIINICAPEEISRYLSPVRVARLLENIYRNNHNFNNMKQCNSVIKQLDPTFVVDVLHHLDSDIAANLLHECAAPPASSAPPLALSASAAGQMPIDGAHGGGRLKRRSRHTRDKIRHNDTLKRR